MAQLLAGGIIAFGLLIILFAIYFAFREQKKSVSSISSPMSEQQAQVGSSPLLEQRVQSGASPTLEEAELPVSQPLNVQENVVVENSVPVTGQAELRSNEEIHSSVWWKGQLSSLHAQLRYLREHAKDVERQIAILSEIAMLTAELEMLQRKHEVSLESKISLFPLRVHRQPTDESYVTDKRPAVRKYTMEAIP